MNEKELKKKKGVDVKELCKKLYHMDEYEVTTLVKPAEDVDIIHSDEEEEN